MTRHFEKAEEQEILEAIKRQAEPMHPDLAELKRVGKIILAEELPEEPDEPINEV